MQARISKRSDAGFWSSAKSFFLPVGERIDPDGARGYPIDLQVKADVPGLSADRLTGFGRLYVAATQYGLGCYERWLAGHGPQWLQSAIAVGRQLVAIQAPDGSWLHHIPLGHTFPLRPPWASAITQGQGASLFVRLHAETGDDQFAAAAVQALAPLFVNQVDGGLRGHLGDLPWPEEYPTLPQSHVLNGAIFALWGIRDVAVKLDSDHARSRYQEGLESLAANLPSYDTGDWSLYSLFPHPIRNYASSFYHDLHVNQLSALQQMDPRPEFALWRDRWASNAGSRSCRVTALAHKAAFRLLVPRKPPFGRIGAPRTT